MRYMYPGVLILLSTFFQNFLGDVLKRADNLLSFVSAFHQTFGSQSSQIMQNRNLVSPFLMNVIEQIPTDASFYAFFAISLFGSVGAFH